MSYEDEIANHQLKAIAMTSDQCSAKYHEYLLLSHQTTNNRLSSKYKEISDVYYKEYKRKKPSEKPSKGDAPSE